MDIVLAMLTSETAEKTCMKKYDDAPYRIQRHVNSGDSNVALYRYLVSNALQYPKRWFDNGQSAKAIAFVDMLDGEISIKNIEVMQKSEGLDSSEIIAEVTKTLNRASAGFPKPSKFPLSLDFLLEWKLRP